MPFWRDMNLFEELATQILWSSTRLSAKSCTWTGVIHNIGTNYTYLEQPCGNGLWDIGGWKIWNELEMCACSPESHPCLGLHKKKCDKYDTTQLESRGLHNNDQAAGAPLLWGQAERDGVQSGEWNALGKLWLFNYIKGAYKKDRERPFTRACSDKIRLMVSNWKKAYLD